MAIRSPTGKTKLKRANKIFGGLSKQGADLGEKMAKIWLKLQENGEKKISNGESDGERKIYPSANPELFYIKFKQIE